MYFSCRGGDEWTVRLAQGPWVLWCVSVREQTELGAKPNPVGSQLAFGSCPVVSMQIEIPVTFSAKEGPGLG